MDETRRPTLLPEYVASPRRDSATLSSSLPDPFSAQDHTHPLTVLKIIVVGVTLFPIRVIVAMVSFFICWLFSRLGLIGYREPAKLQDTKPFRGWRRWCRLPVRLAARGLLFAGGVWWVREKTHPGHKDPAQIIISNHINYFDAFYMLYRNDLSAVGKAELMSWPIVGPIARLFQLIPVARGAKESKEEVRAEIQRRAQPGSGFAPVLVFPEGTTTNGRVIVMFRTGPFSPGEPVRPFCLSYPYRFLDIGNAEAGRTIRSMFEFANFMHVERLPVYAPSPDEKGDPSLYAENVRSMLATTLGVPVTQHTYEDVFLWALAKKAHITQDFEVRQVRDLFKLELSDVKSLMKKFQKLDKNHDGKLTLEDFAKPFGKGEVPSYIRTVFDLLDRTQTGLVDFRQFLFGLTVLHENATIQNKIRVAFQLFDSDGDGVLSREEVAKLVRLCIDSGMLTAPVPPPETFHTSSGGKLIIPGEEESNSHSPSPTSPALDLDGLFAEFDTDGTGSLSQDQFEQAMLSEKYGSILNLPLQLLRQTVLPLSPAPIPRRTKS